MPEKVKREGMFNRIKTFEERKRSKEVHEREQQLRRLEKKQEINQERYTEYMQMVSKKSEKAQKHNSKVAAVLEKQKELDCKDR